MAKLQEKFQKRERVLTAEITPNKGAGIKKFTEHAKLLGPHVDALNVTDCQRSLVRMSSLAASRVLLDLGIEPVYQLTCRDRNSIALQSDVMGASALGVPNLLCLTGDPVKAGDSPKSKSVFEVEAVGLLHLVGKLQTGTDNEGNKLNAKTKLFVGAVVNPTMASQASQLERMKKKRDAGASFFQTQANYDLDDFATFLTEAQSLNVPILAGVLILHSYEVASFIHEHIPGISVPPNVLERLRTASDQEGTGLDIARETMQRLSDLCQGFHLMSIRKEELIPKLLERYYG